MKSPSPSSSTTVVHNLKTTWDLTCFSKDQIKSMTVKPGTNVHKQLCDSLSGKLIGDEKETETEDTSISNINVDENSSYSKNWSLTFLKQCNTHKIVCNEQKFPIGWIDGTGGGNVMEIRKEESASIAIKEAIKERNNFFEEKKDMMSWKMMMMIPTKIVVQNLILMNPFLTSMKLLTKVNTFQLKKCFGYSWKKSRKQI